MNQVTISQSQNDKPTLMGRSHSTAVSVMKNHLVRKNSGELTIASKGAPSESDRNWMLDRIEFLENALKPASHQGIREQVAQLYTVMLARAGGEDDIRTVQTIFCQDLGDLPLFAITEASIQWRRGDIGDRKWAPTPAELRKHIVVIVLPFKKELSDLCDILSAKVLLLEPRPPTAEERRAMIDRVRGVRDMAVDAMKPLYEPKKEPPDVRKCKAEKDAAEAQLDAVSERLRSPVSISPEALRGR